MKGVQKIGSIREKGTGKILGECFAAPNALCADADVISQTLYSLSEVLIRGLSQGGGGGLGGEFGYGADYENDVFMMHHYCWCEKEGECPWCTGCGIYQKRGECVVCADESLTVEQRRSAAPERRCDYVTGRGMFSRFQPWTLDDKRHYYDPPNFWYKPTNLRVAWYKWIGRDMQVNRDVTGLEWGEAMKQCFESIPKVEELQAELKHARESIDKLRKRLGYVPAMHQLPPRNKVNVEVKDGEG